MKYRNDKINNNSSESNADSNASKTIKKQDNQATAGSIIDNFGSDKIDEAALLEQNSHL